MKNSVPFILIILILFSCGEKEKSKEAQQEEKKTEQSSEQNEPTGWEEIMPSIIKFDSYDGNRVLEKGQGFFVAEDLIVTQYSLVSSATKIVFTPFDTNTKYVADKYVAIDRINDLIILQVNNSIFLR